jgi:hypothetical protein
MVVVGYWRVTRTGSPVANELRVFLAFHFYFYVRSLDWGSNFNENLAVDDVSRLVKWKFSLKLYSARGENTAGVCEI